MIDLKKYERSCNQSHMYNIDSLDINMVSCSSYASDSAYLRLGSMKKDGAEHYGSVPLNQVPELIGLLQSIYDKFTQKDDNESITAEDIKYQFGAVFGRLAVRSDGKCVDLFDECCGEITRIVIPKKVVPELITKLKLVSGCD